MELEKLPALRPIIPSVIPHFPVDLTRRLSLPPRSFLIFPVLSWGSEISLS